MKIYVAGPMKGVPDYNFPAFNAMADLLRAEGHEVINPADHGVVDGMEWIDYMRLDIAGLITCDAVQLLPGWRASRGASLEHEIAVRLGLEIFDPR